jgi:hypothetical protein
VSPRPGMLGRSALLLAMIAGLGPQMSDGVRIAIVVRDTYAGHGPWSARVRFLGPGSYSAEVYTREHGITRDVSMQVPLATHAAAWAAAVEQARLLTPIPVVVGETERGPQSPMLEMSAGEFTRRYGIRDDLVKEPPTAEQRAKMQAWMDEAMAKRGPLPVSRSVWRPEDAADLAAKYIQAPDRSVDKGVHGFPADVVMDELTTPQIRKELPRRPLETDFERAQRLAMNTSSDRAFARIGEGTPLAGATLNRISTTRIYASRTGQVGYLEVGQAGWRSSAVTLKRGRKRPVKSPELRAEQAERRRKRGAVKRRRGWV